jgi:DUF438 domain-containing protein
MRFIGSSLSQKEVEALLNALPFQITLVDKEDNIRYYNKPHVEIFLRSKSIICNKIQKCHSEKSIQIVNQILSDFKAGKRDIAKFWVNIDGRRIYNQYIAVREKSGNYLGTMEVTQYITYIKGNGKIIEY